LRSRLYSPDTGRYLTKDSWQGDYNRPLSLNQWNYVEGNPVNYVDPSGYIKESEAQDAWDIMMELKQYQVKIVVDWGYTDNGVLRTLLPVSPDRAKLYDWGCLSWTEGLWTLDDMQAFENGIAIIRRGVTNAGGNYQTLVGAVTVVRQRGNPPTTGAPTINYKVDGASRTYKVYGAIHEMGHIIIGHEAATLNYFKSKLQTSMENGIYNPGPYKGSSSEIYGYTHMPSKYAINNSAEDFAETFREVVVHRYLDSPENKFPNEFNDATSEYDATGIGNPSGVPFNHDIGERLAVMQQIISGNWVTIRHE
jgi:hypothetical protein